MLDVAWLVAFAGIGAFVASRRPENPVGWLLQALPALLVLNFLGEAYYWHAARDEPQHPGALAELGLWVANSSWVPAVIIVLVLLPLLFPTGRPPTPRWRIVALDGRGRRRSSLLVSGGAFAPGPLENYPWVDNPLGLEVDLPAGVDAVGLALWFGSTLAAAASLVVRFRRSHGAERAADQVVHRRGGQLVVAFAVSFSLGAVIGEQASWAIIATALLALALAVAIGVMRYRLYDIDVVINRALVYGGLTATLGGAYLGDGAARSASRSGAQASRSRSPRSRSRRCSARPAHGSRRWSTAASTGTSTTPSGRSRHSPRGCATRWRWTRWTPSSAAWCGRRCSQRTCRCGCGAATSARE